MWLCGTAANAEVNPPLDLPQLLSSEWGTGNTEATRLKRFYALLGGQPAWRDNQAALDAALAAAAAHGLEQGDYAVERVAATVSMPAEASPDVMQDLLRSAAVLRLAADLYAGRVRPAAVQPDWAIAPPELDVAALLAELVRSGDVARLADVAAPPHPGYQQLVAALTRYRATAAQGDGPRIDLAPGTLDVRSGDPRLPALHRRLVLAGDLAAEMPLDNLAAIEAALRRFQARHGLAADGRAGKKTLEALNVSAAQRVEQIVANLERMRWLPRQLPSRHIAVNVADARLALIEDGATTLELRTIVGTEKHPTPMLQAQVVAVTFNPAWNVPTSIARKEILPKLKRNPGYLRDNDMVIRNGSADDPSGLAVDWRTLARFPYLLQQRPGAKNALGATKIELPNRFDVYLHDTPAKALFARPERFFSHGCVRVENVRVLAERLLGADGIVVPANTDGPATVSVPLRRSVPVYLTYQTAFVDAQGAVQFRRDAYGHDARLIAALTARAAASRLLSDTGVRLRQPS
jgi:L,D-transpeptidase YcbB